jgi:hypothetical protein
MTIARRRDDIPASPRFEMLAIFEKSQTSVGHQTYLVLASPGRPSDAAPPGCHMQVMEFDPRTAELFAMRGLNDGTLCQPCRPRYSD